MEKQYNFEDFVKIVEALRSEEGCPWDRQQTHGSLKNCMLNEAQEAVEGIEQYEQTGSWENLCEELGDVLFQVALHSQIAQEEGIFTLEDVIQGISKKMVRRHPHVFDEKYMEKHGHKAPNWEEIKQQERALKQQDLKSNGEKL